MYRDGQGVSRDYVTAYAWFNITAVNGNAFAKREKNNIADKMTQEQIGKAKELYKEMVKKNPKLLKD